MTTGAEAGADSISDDFSTPRGDCGEFCGESRWYLVSLGATFPGPETARFSLKTEL